MDEIYDASNKIVTAQGMYIMHASAGLWGAANKTACIKQTQICALASPRPHINFNKKQYRVFKLQKHHACVLIMTMSTIIASKGNTKLQNSMKIIANNSIIQFVPKFEPRIHCDISQDSSINHSQACFHQQAPRACFNQTRLHWQPHESSYCF